MVFKFATELFLEVAELERFRQSLDDNGFRKNILENSISFGLIKSTANPNFTNGRVERDLDNALNQKTIKIGAILGIDSGGLFIVSDQVNNLPVIADDNWYWVKINHQYNTQEKGKLSVDAAGNLTGTGTEFTTILRGEPNFPSRIKFINSTNNLLEYDVLEVISDTSAIVAHPAITMGGASFAAETNLSYQVVGTFNPEVAIPNDDKFPFQYDSCSIELVPEVSDNTKPIFTIGQEFFLARVRVHNGNLVIQDKRLDYWETKGSDLAIRIDRNLNPLIGIEAVQWQNVFNTGDRNKVQIAWGMRSTNWSIDSSQNILTFFGSSLGGSFKTVADFTNGDFNGMRAYAPNGKYRNIISSIKQGGAINLFLDVLDVDDYSTDGGETFISGEVLVVPNCEEVQIKFVANSTDAINNVNEEFTFPVRTSVADCLVTAYKDPTCLYNIQYRYKSFKELTEWQPINSGIYFTEISFTEAGTLKDVADQVTFTYTSDPLIAFAQLTISPNAFRRFAQTVYKGDVIGVNTITSFSAAQVINLKVGIDKRYQYITGNINVSDDVFISLDRTGAVPGNEFRLHFDAQSISLGANRIIIVDNYSSGVITTLKTITQADVYAMLNQEGGIVIDCVFDDSGKWVFYQNYDLGQAFQTTMFDGVLGDYFDTVSLAGKVRGYFGWTIHTILNKGRVPVGYGSITEAYGAGQPNQTFDFALGTTGGEVKHQTTIPELAKHTHEGEMGDGAVGLNRPDHDHTNPLNDNNATYITNETGGDVPHNNMQPYYVIAFIKRLY